MATPKSAGHSAAQAPKPVKTEAVPSPPTAGQPLTPDHPNAVRIRAATEAGGRGDLSKMPGVKSPDIVVHSSGTSPIGPGAHNRDELDAQDREMFAKAGGTLRAEPYYVLGNDEQVIVVQHATGQRLGRTLNAVLLQVWKMQDGVCHEAWNYFNDLPAWDAFWAD